MGGDCQNPPFAGDKEILRGGRELSKVSEPDSGTC